MYLKTVDFQPKASATSKRLGFAYLIQSQEPAVEVTSRALLARRNGYLGVVDLKDHFFFASFSRIRLSTNGGIRPSTRPPSRKTCFIRSDETYEYSSAAIRKTVSIDGSRRRFISAILSSYS